MKSILIFSMLLSAMVVIAGPIKSSELELLKSRQPKTPEWASSPIASQDVGHRLVGYAGRSTDGVRDTIKKLFYAVDHYSKSKYYPYYLLELCRNLVEVGEDRMAIYWLNRIALLNKDTSLDYNIGRWFGGLAGIKRRALFMQLRVYAGNNLRFETAELIKKLSPLKSSADKLRVAEAWAGISEKKNALRVLGSIELGTGRNDKLIAMHSAILAAGLEDMKLAAKILKPIVNDKSVRESRNPNVKAVSSQAGDLLKNGPGVIPFAAGKFKDGDYYGISRGYVGPLKVKVTVRNGTPAEIKVVSTDENRPRNALTAIPRRIVRNNSIAVDAVTGATVTTDAVCVAVVNALKQALKK